MILTQSVLTKKPETVEEALNEININNDKMFDSYLVGLFIRILPDILDIKDRFAG
jgi:HD-GYP domain-containing protein (c-di-GMP phosphodiesterase class II)